MSSAIIQNVPKNMSVTQYNLIDKSLINNSITLKSRPNHIYTNGRMVKLIMCFECNAEIPAFTTLLTLTDSKLIPSIATNFYTVEQHNYSDFAMKQWQVLDNGTVRSSASYNAHDTIMLELNYPVDV